MIESRPARPRRFGKNDLNLLIVILSWALNLSVVKFAFLEMDPKAFNAVRFAAATLFLVVLIRGRGRGGPLPARDQRWMILLGLIGHTAYQAFFIEGIARTTATHAALIFGVTPVMVAMLTQWLGHERVGATGWGGAILAFGGVYVIIAGRPPAEGPAPSLIGDLLILAAGLCWALYTVLARPLLERHSPLRVTTLSMVWGTLFLIPLCVPALGSQDWTRVGLVGASATLYGIFFPLVIAYVLWYRSVREVGSLRTAVYANLVPVAGALAGWVLLGERLYPALGLGAAAIFAGIALTRREMSAHPSGD